MRGTELAVVLLALWTAVAHGGDSKGNGGNGVVCRDKNQDIRYLELLDFWEARELRGIRRKLEGPAAPWEKSVDLALRRLERLDRKRAATYRGWAARFVADTVFQPGVILVVIDDSFHLSFPKDCKVEQVAIQREPVFPEDRRFLVSDDLWRAMDEENRAGLVLHETILREAVALGQKDSRASRYFTSLVASDAFERLTAEDYHRRLELMGFPKNEEER